MSYIATFILYIAYFFAGLFGSKKRIIVDENSIHIDFVRPKNREKYHWQNLYKDGIIYWRNVANPIKLTNPKESDKEYITSTEYRTFMKQSVIQDALDTAANEWDLQTMLMIGNLVLVFILLIIQLGAMS